MIESLVGTIHRRNTLQHKIFQQRLQLFGISFQVLCYVRLSKIRSGLRFTSKQGKSQGKSWGKSIICLFKMIRLRQYLIFALFHVPEKKFKHISAWQEEIIFMIRVYTGFINDTGKELPTIIALEDILEIGVNMTWTTTFATHAATASLLRYYLTVVLTTEHKPIKRSRRYA